jgi:glycosyltransferase involved in cell wall biosynthesis
MIIALNTLTYLSPDAAIEEKLNLDFFLSLVQNNHHHQFIFITTKNNIVPQNSSNNYTVITLPIIKNLLHFNYLVNYKIPTVLKKNKVNLLVSINFCSKNTAVPQCLIFKEVGFLSQPNLLSKKVVRFYKNKLTTFLQNASQIITTSQTAKNKLTTNYSIPNDKINVGLIPMAEKGTTITWDEKEAIKNRYANSKEYFLYQGSVHPINNVINLLKAFSQFKKWQKSNLQLLLIVKEDDFVEAFKKELSHYKHKDEVVLLSNLLIEEEIKITKAAYAMLHVSKLQNVNVGLLQALQFNIPIVVSDSAEIKEFFADAALYVNENEVTDIAQKMMLVFKDENKRNLLVLKAEIQLNKYMLQSNLNYWWQLILKTIAT